MPRRSPRAYRRQVARVAGTLALSLAICGALVLAGQAAATLITDARAMTAAQIERAG